MPRVVTPRQLPGAVQAEVVTRVRKAGVGELLASQAQARIAAHGDSEHTYPELWATKTGLGYRANGEPLRDTGMLFNMLSGRDMAIDDGVRSSLNDGSGHGVKHQHGFVNPAPVFIALSRAAARWKVTGRTRKEIRFNAIQAGLVEGKNEDFIVLKRDAHVPPRKIFNMPRENRRQLVDVVSAAAAGKKG